MVRGKLLYLAVALALLAGFLPAGMPAAADVAPPSPIAAWHFDEGSGTIANDSSGNGFTGNFHGAPGWVPGIQGSALRFSDNDYVDVGTSNSFNFNNGSGNFTIDAWIKPESIPSYASAIVGKATEGSNHNSPPFSGWSFYFYGPNDGAHPPQSLGFGGNGVWEITSSAGIINAGEWVRVSVTKSGGTYTLYKNGLVVASAVHGNLETSTASLKIGRDYPDGSPDLYGFVGLIDEVRIYDIALTAEQLVTPPTVTTNNATSITGSSAVLSGNLTSLGTAISANVSYQWGLSANYTNETPGQVMNSTGNFSANLTSLSANTTYHFRAKAVGNLPNYGNDMIFTTLTMAAPPTFLFKWGTTGSGDGQFNRPVWVAVDVSGNVYVADTYNHRIQKFTGSGAFITKWGSLGSGDGQFYYPTGVTIDASGNVLVADSWNNRIQKFTSSGVFITKWGSLGSGDGQFKNPQGVAVDAAGNVYVSDTSNTRIQKFTGSGAFIAKWGSSGSADGQFGSPEGVTVDASGNVYVADRTDHRIQVFSASGDFLTKWGSLGSGDGQFNGPGGVVVDTSGNVYVSDINNNRIQKFTSSGGFVAKWGSLGSGDSQFNQPEGVAINNSGNVYVADTFNHRIQVFGTAPLPGDANGDGVVNALDITRVERIIVGLDPPTPGADANLDGKVNAVDTTKVERIIAGTG